MAGRPTVLTPELQDEAIRLIRAGNYQETVADALGIGTTTWYRWLEDGEKKGTEPYASFRDAVRTAMAQAEIDAVAHERLGSSADGAGAWQASSWWLERTRRAKFGKNVLDLDLEALKPQVIHLPPTQEQIDAAVAKVLEAREAKE